MVNGIFNNPAFSMESLTASINTMPFIETKARTKAGVAFRGISTTTVDLEFDVKNVKIIPYTRRGEPATAFRANKRTMRTLKVPHVQLESLIGPERVQNVRLFGTSNQLAAAVNIVDDEMRTMSASLDATLEYATLGAIKGVIYDSDGTTVIYNLFTEMGVSQDTVDFALDDTNGDIRGLCTQVKRLIEKALGSGQAMVGVGCFCGDSFWDQLISHPNVKEAYTYWAANGGQMGDALRNDLRADGFTFGGITFWNYSCTIGSVDYVATGDAHFFPMAPGLFQGVFAPANTIEAANTIGLPRYAMSEPLDYGRGLGLLVESNPLVICGIPKALVKGTA